MAPALGRGPGAVAARVQGAATLALVHPGEPAAAPSLGAGTALVHPGEPAAAPAPEVGTALVHPGEPAAVPAPEVGTALVHPGVEVLVQEGARPLLDPALAFLTGLYGLAILGPVHWLPNRHPSKQWVEDPSPEFSGRI